MTSDEGVYLYAVTRDEGRTCPPDLTGVAGAPVRTVAHRGLAAYVSTVPLDRFGEEPLRRSMEDLAWLEATARAHHHVVETVAQESATVPVRLVTVYHGEDQVRGLLEERHDDFRTVLARIAGRREWGVKAYADPGPPPAAGADDSAADSPGMAYLKRRRASLRSREEVWRRAAARAEEVHTGLMAIAVAGRRHRAQDPQLSGRTEQMVLNTAYLVDEERGAEFVRTLDGLRGEGIEVELTGPWAPYSFTLLDRREEQDDVP